MGSKALADRALLRQENALKGIVELSASCNEQVVNSRQGLWLGPHFVRLIKYFDDVVGLHTKLRWPGHEHYVAMSLQCVFTEIQKL